MISVAVRCSASRAASIATAGELEQADVPLTERARAQRTDVHHADHATFDVQRHAEHRADPALVEDRVDDFGSA
jgi:hypothetical protein